MTALIRAGHVLTMGAAGDLRDGAVLVDGETIAAVGPYSELACPRLLEDAGGVPFAAQIRRQ